MIQHAKTFHSVRHQRGAVTLVVTLIVVLAMALLTYTMSTTTTLENRITSTDLRSKQALHAAQAGLDYALAQMMTDGGLATLNTCVERTVEGDDATGILDQPTFELRFGGAVECPSAMLGMLTSSVVRSIGRSADGSAVRVLEARAEFRPVWLSVPPEEPEPDSASALARPMIAMESVNWEGTAETGHCDRRGESNPGRKQCSQIVPPGKPFAGLEDFVYVEAGGTIDGGSTGVPWIRLEDQHKYENPSLPNDTDVFFEYIFGVDKESFKGGSAQYPKKNADGTLDYSLPDHNVDEVIWWDGDLTLAGGDILGDEDKPVTIVVTGNLDMVGNSVLWGVVYVMGSTGVGNSKIVGALASETDINLTGTAAVVYNEKLATPGALTTAESGEAATLVEKIDIYYSSDAWREIPAD